MQSNDEPSVSAELSPERRQQIYAEEQARLEAQQELRAGRTSTIGRVFLWIFGILVALFIFGSFLSERDDQAWRRLTPAQQRDQALKDCAFILKHYEYRLYSELSPEERQVKASCEARLSTR
jgi:hypothetical protein